MSFLQVDIYFKSDYYDFIIGELYKLNCDSIWEEENYLKAYFDNKLYSQEKLRYAIQSIAYESIESFSISQLKDENWNSKWEEAFSPVRIDEICFIYADFHEKEVGFPEQRELFDRVAQKYGKAPPVIDSDDMLENPHKNFSLE